MRPTRFAAVLFLVATALGPACACPRAEDVEAKERLFSPPPPDPMKAKAEEPIDAGALADNPEMFKRVSRMGFREAHARLGSMVLTSTSELSFSRDKLKVEAAEDVKVVYDTSGDFSVHLVTGNESTQELIYANDVLFLKNNNGQWRASRDPTGERIELLEDSAGVWRSFYDLFVHALTIENRGGKRVAGRDGIAYGLTVTNKSAEAEALGKDGAPLNQQPSYDGGPPPLVEETPEQKQALLGRLAKWRERARAAGGSGEMVVDADTGVILKVDFKGSLVVGDEPTLAKLNVKMKYALDGIGKDHEVKVPKEAIEEVTRKHWPVDPRGRLEEKGIVPPLPKEEGAAGANATAGEGK